MYSHSSFFLSASSSYGTRFESRPHLCSFTSFNWLHNSPLNSKIQKQMPKLSQLFFILNTIPATSAAIERFFSIAGIVNDKRRLRMRDDLVIQRTMIKSNMKLLENSSKKFVWKNTSSLVFFFFIEENKRTRLKNNFTINKKYRN